MKQNKKTPNLKNMQFDSFKFFFLFSVIAVTVLFLSFLKTAFLSAIFAFAIIGVKDRTKKSYEKNKFLFFSVLGVASSLLVMLTHYIIKATFSLMGSVSDPGALANLKLKISELYLPSFILIKKIVLKFLFQFDNTRFLEKKMLESVGDIFDSVITFVMNVLYGIPNNIVHFFFFIFFVIFLILKKNKLESYIEVFISDKNLLMFIINNAKKSAYISIITTLVTAFFQASLLTIGAVLVGISAWPIVFISAFFSAMLPMIGVLPVALVCSIYAGTVLELQSVLIIVVFGIAATLIDNILRPFLMAGEDSMMNPIFCFFALIGSLSLFGFSGLFIGPFVLVFTSSVFQNYNKSLL